MSSGKLSRRHLLGLGALASLSPFASSLRVRAQDPRPVPKLIVYASASGWLVGANGRNGAAGWLPPSLQSGSGRAEAPLPGNAMPILAPLERHADKITVLDNFSGTVRALPHPNAHQHAPLLLTGGDIHNHELPRGSGGDGDFQADAKSLDQIVAEQFGSRVLALSYDINGFQKGEGYLSHTAPGVPYIPIQSHLEAYDRVHAVVGEMPEVPTGGTSDAERRRAVLERMTADLDRLRGRLPAQDHARLARHRAHLETLRSEAAGGPLPTGAMCTLGERPEAFDPLADANFPRLMRSYTRTMVASMQCGYTRVGLLQAGNLEGSLRASWPEFGVNSGINEHAMSHRFDGLERVDAPISQAEAVQQGIKVQTMHNTLFAEVLDALSSTPDVDGTPMLDHTIVMHVKPMGTNHDRQHLMWLVAGGSALGMRGGRYLRLGGGKYINDVLTGVAGHLGVSLPSIGVARQNTGPISFS